MAIADTISSMYENVGEVYDTITNVDINNGTNLLDYSTCKIGDLNTGTGAEETSTVRIISDFIEVTPNENYICTLIGGDYTTYYYSSNKAFISGGSSWIGSGNSFTTPNNTGYLRLKFKNANNTTISLNDLSNVMLNKGTTALPYEPYTDNPTYKNIENIPKVIRNSYLEIMNNGIDKIWNNWEKVTGEGETLTLNSTEEAPMKINLKGNTSQETTTGKNLLDLTNLTPSTKNGITLTKNNDGTITLNGTATGDANFGFPIDSIVANDTYKVQLYKKSGNFTGNYVSIYMSVDSAFSSFDLLSLTSTDMISMSLGDKTYTYAQIKVNSGVICNNLVVGCQVVSDASVTEFQKYTGGIASPSPSYPQDIHVVSGDNSIDVCGKNLAKSFSQPTYNIYNDILDIGIDNINALKGQTITISFDSNKTGKVYENENFFTTSLPIDIVVGRNTITRVVKSDLVEKATTYADGKWRILKNYVSTNECIFTNVQLELSNQATTYQPYKGASYPISLGVENLLSTKNYGNGNSGIGITSNEENTLQVSGTATANSNILIEFSDITLKAGTYYFYLLRTKTTRVDISLRTTNYAQISSANFGNVFQNTLNNRQFTLESDTIIHAINFYFPSGTVATDTYKIMICKETHTEKEFTLYGKAIELCKIGDYQDRIFKSSGKNVCNITSLTPKLYGNGIPTGNSNSIFVDSFDSTNITFHSNSNNFNEVLSNVIQLKPNTQYTIKFTRTTTSTNNQWFIYDYNNGTYSINYRDNNTNVYEYTFTTNSIGQIALAFGHGNTTGTTTISNIMLNEGTTALPYEPYGKVWYLNKQIGKIVLDGTQNITLASSGTRRFNATYTTLGISNVKEGTSAEDTTLNYRMNDHFIYSAGQNTWGRYYLYNNWLVMLDSGSAMVDANALKTWLASNNTIIYYVLATPTYTEITDTTLLEQLEALYNAKSKNSQTNISQENNDLPFILDVTALKQLTQ